LWACLVLQSGLAEYFAGGQSIKLYAIAGSRTFYRLGFKIDTYMNFWYKQLRIGIHKLPFYLDTLIISREGILTFQMICQKKTNNYYRKYRKYSSNFIRQLQLLNVPFCKLLYKYDIFLIYLARGSFSIFRLAGTLPCSCVSSISSFTNTSLLSIFV